MPFPTVGLVFMLLFYKRFALFDINSLLFIPHISWSTVLINYFEFLLQSKYILVLCFFSSGEYRNSEDYQKQKCGECHPRYSCAGRLNSKEIVVAF